MSLSDLCPLADSLVIVSSLSAVQTSLLSQLTRLNSGADDDALATFLAALDADVVLAQVETTAAAGGDAFTLFSLAAFDAMCKDKPLMVAAYTDFVSDRQKRYESGLGPAFVLFTKAWCEGEATLTNERYLLIASALTVVVERRMRFFDYPAFADDWDLALIFEHLLSDRKPHVVAGLLRMVVSPDVDFEARKDVTNPLHVALESGKKWLSMEAVEALFKDDEICLALNPYFECAFDKWEGMEEQASHLRKRMSDARCDAWKRAEEVTRDLAARRRGSVGKEGIRMRLKDAAARRERGSQ